MKKKTKIIIAVIVVPILLVGTLLYVMGYRGMPVAKTAEEFDDFMRKEILGFGMMYDLQIGNNGNLHYTLSEEEIGDSGASWLAALVAENGASFHIDLKPGGSYQFPFSGESLVAKGWKDYTGYIDYARYGDWYSNSKGKKILLREHVFIENFRYEGLIMLRRLGGLPGFNLGGVTNDSNMDDIIENLGTPYSISFYPEGYSIEINAMLNEILEVTSDPCARMSYFVFSDGVYQYGVVSIIINTAKNAVEAVMLDYYGN